MSGMAEILIEIVEPEDLRKDGDLKMICAIYDDAVEKMDHERLDNVLLQEWEKASWRQGQPMMAWITDLRNNRIGLQLQAPASAISETALASSKSFSVRALYALTGRSIGYDKQRVATV
ncbi:unnamed protein product [Prorocentrum cordatum]|uniref:Uncharacterized protein n=1 Tax=Prorocentrum cordatum TaxID=2364126 RepID=A0ABN9THY0_9DINO|nr:unnamed protein product [Polarella glacialis]